MAIASLVQWEVRTAGSDTNGGGFKTGASGTDYSQEDSNRIATGSNDSVTDAVGTGTNTVTSSTAAFTSAIVGNVVYLQSAWYEVTAYNSATSITVDRNTGTFTAGTLNIGGAFATLKNFANSANMSLSSSGLYRTWIKAGTYTLTSTWTVYLNGSGIPRMIVRGYDTTRGDNTGTRPLITSSTNSVNLITITSGSVWTWENIKFTHTASTRGLGIVVQNSPITLTIRKCIFDGLSNALNGDNVGAHFPFRGLFIQDSHIQNCTSDGILTQAGVVFVIASEINSCTGSGLKHTSVPSGGNFVLIDSIFRSNGGDNVVGPSVSSVTGMPLVVAYNCTFRDATNDNLDIDGAGSIQGPLVFIRNNIFWSAGGWGLNYNTSVSFDEFYSWDYNAYGDNTSGDIRNLSAGTGDVSLSSTPFTGTTDSSLDESGDGGDLIDAGYPGVFLSSTCQGFKDIGAVEQRGEGGEVVMSYIT